MIFNRPPKFKLIIKRLKMIQINKNIWELIK
jgi:hypothetical protein